MTAANHFTILVSQYDRKEQEFKKVYVPRANIPDRLWKLIVELETNRYRFEVENDPYATDGDNWMLKIFHFNSRQWYVVADCFMNDDGIVSSCSRKVDPKEKDYLELRGWKVIPYNIFVRDFVK